MDKFEQERDWIASQEAHFDYIDGCVLDDFHNEENMQMLRNGFDIVCHVSRKQMLASDCIMATVIKGKAREFALREQQANPKLNLVVIYSDGPRACDWLIVDETAFL